MTDIGAHRLSEPIVRLLCCSVGGCRWGSGGGVPGLALVMV